MQERDDLRKIQYQKMTGTPIPKLLLSLSIPTVITMLVTSVYNAADTAFVGSLGTSASGAVGVVFGYMAILQATGFLFGQGCGSILARELGSKEGYEASKTASTGFFMALFISVIEAVLSFVFLDKLVYILGSTETIAPYAKTYMLYILVAAPLIVPSFTLNNILRYEGKAKLGAAAMMSGALLNIGGDALFILVFNMGIEGAGLSTALSQLVSFCILLSSFLTKKTQTMLSFKLFIEGTGKISNILLTGLPSLLRQTLGGASSIVLNYVAKPYHDEAIAAMAIVSRVSFMVISVGLGIGQGFQPISSFNYGAKKYRRVREAFKTTVIAAEAVIVVLSVLVFIFSPEIIRFLRDDDNVVEIGIRALRLHSLCLVFMPPCMMGEMLLQTTGKRLQASLLSSCRSGLILVPVLLLMAWLRGLAGIQEAQPLAYIISAIPALILIADFFKKLPKEDITEEVAEQTS